MRDENNYLYVFALSELQLPVTCTSDILFIANWLEKKRLKQILRHMLEET